MSEILPIEWEDKKNSPELLAFLQQFGNEYYLSAEEINELRDKLNFIIENSQQTSNLDDVLEGYLVSNVFYTDSLHTVIIPAESGKIYIDITAGQKNKLYRYTGSTYNKITNGIITNTDDVTESITNLYYTAARALAKQDALVSGTNIKTVNGSTLLGSGNLITPDMDTTNPQDVSGLKTFLSAKFGLRNLANTFTSFFTNSNTASRTYTLQNRNGTLLDDTDLTTINTSLATKQSVFTGTANYLTKSINATTLAISRIFDNGNFLGIGTMNAPLKDITLGYQADREIGIEDSDNSTVGRNLRISSGRTLNYIANVNFIALNQTSRNWTAITADLNGDIYAGVSGGDIYKQVGGGGNFVAIGQAGLLGWNSMATAPNRDIYAVQQGIGIYKKTSAASLFTAVSTGVTVGWEAITVAPNGDVYACSGSADIYKQTGGTGTFVALGQTSRNWRGICAAPNGDIYACVINGDIYKQTGGTGNFVALGQTSRVWKAMAASPSGDIYACITGGGADIFKQTGGLGNFIAMGQTNRNYNSLAVAPNGNVYTTTNGDIYYQLNNATGTPNLDGGNLDLVTGTGKGGGKSRLRFITGQKTASGTNMQVETLRAYIDENGFMVWINMPTYPDNTTALAAGLPVGCEYKTATGDRKIVY